MISIDAPLLKMERKEGGCVRREEVCRRGEWGCVKEYGRDMWDKEWVEE
jgi:hypothetical protein